MGRAWRNGQTDAAIGSAGVPVLYAYAGAHDAHGNELLVTEVAVADEIAAEAVEMTVFEDFVTDMVQNQGRSILGLYPPTDPQSKDDFAAWRQAKGR